jgi:hypothetical protein
MRWRPYAVLGRHGLVKRIARTRDAGSAAQSTQPCGSVAKLDRGGKKQKIG